MISKEPGITLEQLKSWGRSAQSCCRNKLALFDRQQINSEILARHKPAGHIETNISSWLPDCWIYLVETDEEIYDFESKEVMWLRSTDHWNRTKMSNFSCNLSMKRKTRQITAPILPITHHVFFIFTKLKQTVLVFADSAVFRSEYFLFP